MRTLATRIVIGLLVLAPGACDDNPTDLADPEPGETDLPTYAATDGEQEESGEDIDPGGQPFLLDDVYRQVWMFISDRGPVLTPVFDASVFPEGARPVAGPVQALTSGAGLDADSDASSSSAQPAPPTA